MSFSCINIGLVPREVLKTVAEGSPTDESQNRDQTWFFHAFTFARSPGSCSKPLQKGLGEKYCIENQI